MSYNLFIYHFITYWSLCSVFFVYDYLCDEIKSKINKPIGSDNIYKINWQLYKQSIAVSLKIQLLIFMPIISLVYPYYTFAEFTMFDTIKSLFISSIIEEFYFYYTHRLLHNNKFWRFHSKHHEIITTVSAGTLNSSIFENLVCNLFPIVMMPFIINMSYNTAMLWTIMATFFSVTSHCGFLIFNCVAKFHSLHHLNRTCNYGVLGIADRIHRTYAY